MEYLGNRLQKHWVTDPLRTWKYGNLTISANWPQKFFVAKTWPQNFSGSKLGSGEWGLGGAQFVGAQSANLPGMPKKEILPQGGWKPPKQESSQIQFFNSDYLKFFSSSIFIGRKWSNQYAIVHNTIQFALMHLSFMDLPHIHQLKFHLLVAPHGLKFTHVDNH